VRRPEIGYKKPVVITRDRTTGPPDGSTGLIGLFDHPRVNRRIELDMDGSTAKRF
jgi:hypothetical protein